VLKALALVLGPLLPISRRCVHVKGHGGAKAALRQAAARLRRLPFVLRTDVRGWYVKSYEVTSICGPYCTPLT
jgi:hypothetical protein